MSSVGEKEEHEICSKLPLPLPQPCEVIENVILAQSSNKRFNIEIELLSGTIKSIQPAQGSDGHKSPLLSGAAGGIALPSLCHPHIHLDKPYLLSHPTTAHLAPKSGDFKEALSMTSEAKKLYTPDSLLERGNWLIADSLRAGVTHMRAFVEVDATVKHMCLQAGLELKRLWTERCEIQICAFAQDPLFSGNNADENRRLMEEAGEMEGVDAIGSTPYVENDDEKGRQNIEWMIKLATEQRKHLDFHLDYFLDEKREPLVWHVIDYLKSSRWTDEISKTVCLGHCTRLTSFSTDEWNSLAALIKQHSLPIYFVGLPTSDLFMMGRLEAGQELQDKRRATLQVPWIIGSLGLGASLGINNVGNAFTPQGSADPLSLTTIGVGLYQAGTAKHAQILFECVSVRAREAIGLSGPSGVELAAGDPANLVVFERLTDTVPVLYRHRRSVQEVVYDPPNSRMVIFRGKNVRI